MCEHRREVFIAEPQAHVPKLQRIVRFAFLNSSFSVVKAGPFSVAAIDPN